MQNWEDLYLEHAQMITEKIPEVRWVDLWHNQVNFLTEEHPFPTPATFLSYRILKTKDVGNKVQEVTLQVDTYFYYETFADTYVGGINQESALDFVRVNGKIYAIFQATDGENYSSMTRIGFGPVDTGNAGNLYRTSFSCIVMDYSALKPYDDHELEEIDIDHSNAPYQL